MWFTSNSEKINKIHLKFQVYFYRYPCSPGCKNYDSSKLVLITVQKHGLQNLADKLLPESCLCHFTYTLDTFDSACLF